MENNCCNLCLDYDNDSGKVCFNPSCSCHKVSQPSGEEWEKPLIEQLAAIEHQRWADWHSWATAYWTSENLARWNKQAETKYEDLTEAEKEKDREQVMRYWPLISRIAQEERVKGREGEYKEWREGRRCENCGGKKESNMCEECFKNG